MTAEGEIDYLDFIRRVRQGDEGAAEELVRRYEAEIRTEVRAWLRMRDPRLRRVFDSIDVCQSVMADFFARSALGDFELDDPRSLIRLLVGMARNKLAEQVRYHYSQRRDVRIVGEFPADGATLAADSERPSKIISGRELLETLRGRLTEEERALVDLRAQGEPWSSIALALGGTPEARRKQFARALTRVAGDLDLE